MAIADERADQLLHQRIDRRGSAGHGGGISLGRDHHRLGRPGGGVIGVSLEDLPNSAPTGLDNVGRNHATDDDVAQVDELLDLAGREGALHSGMIMSAA